ncbi:hypothetical protein [Streptomyces sp. NPDC087859]|uniref:hypothetical protein n=1 Tax=Streptomyces sp. NPDC087859 TaxID=3365812 RepID=UPI003818D683
MRGTRLAAGDLDTGVRLPLLPSEAELEEGERAWISEKLTQFRRMLTGAIGPHLALFPKSVWAAYLSDQMKAIESTLAWPPAHCADLVGRPGRPPRNQETGARSTRPQHSPPGAGPHPPDA